MESILTFISIIFSVFGILQIILFFKVWGMTNNVSEMKNMMELFLRKDFQAKDGKISQNTKFESDIKIEDLVVELKNERQLKVVDITDNGEFECTIPGGISPVGIFNRNEIELFEKYWNKSK